VSASRRVLLLTLLGAAGVLLVLGGVALFVAVGMGVHFRPPVLVVIPSVVGLPIAVFVWNRAAHVLAEMARGNIERSGRRAARVAHRLGVIGSEIGLLIVAAIVLAIVVGTLVLGSDEPY
jgi:hypothetical protein